MRRDLRRSRRRRRKTKEAETIAIPALPNAAQFRAWKNAVFTNVDVAAGREDNKALRWVQKVDHEATMLAHLGPDRRKQFGSLNKKLAAALINPKVAKGELGRRLYQFCEDCMKYGKRAACGRELLWLILSYYKTSKHAEVMFDISDLQKVELKKGQSLESFQNSWIAVFSGLKRQPDKEFVEVTYYNQAK